MGLPTKKKKGRKEQDRVHSNAEGTHQSARASARFGSSYLLGKVGIVLCLLLVESNWSCTAMQSGGGTAVGLVIFLWRTHLCRDVPNAPNGKEEETLEARDGYKYS